MTAESNHIGVGICTYKRPDLLRRSLRELISQETGGLFTYSIVVVDNDRQRSAETIVSEFAASSPVPIAYCVEPVQNICLARNRAVDYAKGNFVAFIDDDEFPEKNWLLMLFKAVNTDDVAGVLGPVKSFFDEATPSWVVKCRFFDRPGHPTGFVIDWSEGRTGNVILKRSLLVPGEPAFDPKFHRGGDTDFFRRMIQKGNVFIWCDEAVVHEVVPPERWKRSFMLKRALLRGSITLKDPAFGIGSVVKSLIATVAYTIALPFAFLLGQHRFMDLLVRLCDHLGKILAFIGINPVKSPYVTD